MIFKGLNWSLFSIQPYSRRLPLKTEAIQMRNTATIRTESPTVLLLYELPCFDARFINFNIKHAKFVE